MNLIVFMRGGDTIWKESRTVSSYSFLRSSMGMIPAIAETCGFDDVLIYHPLYPDTLHIREGSDLDIMREVYNGKYTFNFTNEIYPEDFIYSSVFIYHHSHPQFLEDLHKLQSAVSLCRGLIYVETDRELIPDESADFPRSSLLFQGNVNPELRSWLSKHLAAIITNSHGDHLKMLQDAFGSITAVLHCQMLDIDLEGNVMPYLPIKGARPYDLVLMKSLRLWDPYLRGLKGVYRILSLDNSGMLKKKAADINEKTQHTLDLESLSLGCKLNDLHNRISRAKLVTQSGRPDFHPARDWSTHKLFEAARAGCLSMVSETNPRRYEILKGLPSDLLVSQDRGIEPALEYVHDMSISDYEEAAHTFRANVKHLSRRDYWVPLLDPLAELIE